MKKGNRPSGKAFIFIHTASRYWNASLELFSELLSAVFSGVSIQSVLGSLVRILDKKTNGSSCVRSQINNRTIEYIKVHSYKISMESILAKCITLGPRRPLVGGSKGPPRSGPIYCSAQWVIVARGTSRCGDLVPRTRSWVPDCSLSLAKLSIGYEPPMCSMLDLIFSFFIEIISFSTKVGFLFIQMYVLRKSNSN